MPVKKLYTEPIISKPKSGEWCVFFRFYDHTTGKMRVIKRTEGLNRIRDRKEKRYEFGELLLARKRWLEEGWNPVIDPDFKERNKEETPLTEFDILKQLTFSEALDFAYEKKLPDWKKKTQQCFHSAIGLMKKQADRLSFLDTKISELKRPHYIDLLDGIRKHQKLTPQGFNKYRSFLVNLIDKIVAYDVLEYNPVDKIQKKKPIKLNANRPPTEDEQDLIIETIKEKEYNFYRPLAVLYGCSIRPKGICHLQIKDLKRSIQVFRLVPRGENTKTSVEHDSSIPDWVLALIDEMELHRYKPSDYLFTLCNERGRWLPGPIHTHPNRLSETWKAIVKEGLGLDVNQYGLKKKAGDDMIRLKRREGTENLISIAQQQMGHTSSRMTRNYTNEDEVINRELIKRKMPVL